MLLLLLTSAFFVNGDINDYEKFTTCINHKKFEMTEDIKTGISPAECAELCDGLKKCKSFEYNEDRQECRPQRKYKPNEKCKKVIAGEFLYSLPDPAQPAPPSVPAAASKKGCFQIGGPNQIWPTGLGTCEHLGPTFGITKEECVELCVGDSECTDAYAEDQEVCMKLKCPESSDRLSVASEFYPDSKHEGMWYGCKESQDRCPVMAIGAQTVQDTDNPCEFRGVMDGKTKDDCETLCLEQDTCDAYYFDPEAPICGSLQCSAGLPSFRPEAKMSATGKYYKCQDGTLGDGTAAATVTMQKAESSAAPGLMLNMFAATGLAVTLFGAFRYYTSK